MIELSIVIVNYNTCTITGDCVRSIVNCTKDLKYEIIIVDNNSHDNSKEILTAEFPNMIWVQNVTNEGFGKANNRGIAQAKGEVILLLNSDTLITDNTIQQLYQSFVVDSVNVGMATCQLINKDGSNQRSVFNEIASFKSILKWNLPIERLFRKQLNRTLDHIEAVNGACMIFNRQRINSIGYFDEDFFMYSEELEWCRRIRNSGLEIKQYKEHKIMHLEEASSNSKIWNTKQRMVSSMLLFKKVHGFFGLLFFFFLNNFNWFCNLLFIWSQNADYRKGFKRHSFIRFSLFFTSIRVMFGVFKRPLKVD